MNVRLLESERFWKGKWKGPGSYNATWLRTPKDQSRRAPVESCEGVVAGSACPAANLPRRHSDRARHPLTFGNRQRYRAGYLSREKRRILPGFWSLSRRLGNRRHVVASKRQP